MDTMLHKLEKYADNLESIVQQRTAELIEEKQKTDMLINRMLPPYVSLYSAETAEDLIVFLNTLHRDVHKNVRHFAITTANLYKIK